MRKAFGDEPTEYEKEQKQARRVDRDEFIMWIALGLLLGNLLLYAIETLLEIYL